MRDFLIVFSFILLTIVLLSCKQADNLGTLDYGSLNYDSGRIAIFKWDTTKYLFPNNSTVLSLTQQDLAVTDSLLKDAVDSFNVQMSPRLFESFDGKVPLDSFIIKQEKYKYQYFPFKDVNGQRIIQVIGFSTNFQPWKAEMYQPGVHYGMHMFDLKINLSEKTRENIHSGDFG